MTDERTDKIKHLHTVIETRQLGPSALAEHVLALMRLGESVFVVHDRDGGRSLAYARAVAATADAYTLEFTRVRALAPSEVAALELVGVGVFKPPRPPARLESQSVQG